MKETWTSYAYRCDGLDGGCSLMSPISEEGWAEAHHKAEQEGWYVSPGLHLCLKHAREADSTVVPAEL